MSDNERMERAKRIRRMREGQRDEEESDDRRNGSAADDTAPASVDGADPGEQEKPSPAETVENVAGTSASIPSAEEMESAMERTMDRAEAVESDGQSTDAGTGETDADVEADGADTPTPDGIAERSSSREAETRVLEFTLADEQYCLDIEYIEEIVKQETITRVPNTPEFVEGVVDLRGQITTLLNPKIAIDKDDRSAGDHIVVFDSEAFEDQGHIGWVVDDVRQVSPVTDDQVNDPPMGEDYINGVIDREDDDQFVIWTKPDLALEQAE